MSAPRNWDCDRGLLMSFPPLGSSTKMAEGGPHPPDLETQKNDISNLLKKPLKPDDIWYLVDNKWFKQWKKYVGYDTWDVCGIGEQTTHPGPIDNSPLLKEDNSGETKDHLIDELDYVLLPQEAWDKMVSWYGLTPGQDPLPRRVIEFGMFVKHCKVEVYLMDLKLCLSTNLEQCITKKFSKVDTIDRIEKEMRNLFSIPKEKETRLWNRYSSNTYEHLFDRTRTVQEAGLYHGQVIMIEEQNDDGSWSRKSAKGSAGYCNSSGGRGGDAKSYNAPANTIATRSYSAVGNNYGNYSNSCNYELHGGGSTPGLCGLANLGNTCFMNAAVQCMSNTPPLTEYFMEGRHLQELNHSNPLGMKGEVAKSYADLIRVMWSGNCSSTIPRPFKMVVGRFAPQFSGFQQQDCQELMAFLLDGLHEDLNRVIHKPYIELRDPDGRPDELVAQEAWHNYQLRNNSIIVDIFHGLLKSTLVCPDCQKLSVTFDPFCYLSLPLPIRKEKLLELVLVRADPHEKPLKMKVTVIKMSSIQDVCSSVSRLVGIPADRLLVTEVHNHRFLRVLQNTDPIDTLDRMEVFVYELPQSLNQDNSTYFLPVYLREKSCRYVSNNCNVPVYQLFSQPFFVSVPAKDCTYDMLYKRILKCLARYVTPPKPGEEWWTEENMDKQNGEVDVLNGSNEESFHDADEECADGREEEGGSAAAEEERAPNHKRPAVDKPPRRLFSLHTINENGSLNLDSLEDGKEPLKLGPRTYLGADWLPQVRARFFKDHVTNDMVVHESMHQRQVAKRQLQLRECLELFTTTEKLGAEDPWFCPSCRSHKQATKKFDLWSLPRVLIIHLKRFSYNRFWRDKIDTLVEFPISNLRMHDYIINQKHGPAVYDLIAVANHYGGMGGGHYTAYAKNKETEQWYYFDDNSVSPATEDNVVSKAAYVLFYAKRGEGRSRNPSASASASSADRQCSSASGSPVDEEHMDLS